MNHDPSSGGAGEAVDCDIGLIVHAAESRDQGGPSVRVPRTAATLRDLGLDAHVLRDGVPRQLAHVHNIWPFAEAFTKIRRLKRCGVRVVFSPILLLPARGVAEGLGASLHQILPEYDSLLVQKALLAADRIVALSAAEADAVRALSGGGPRCTVVQNPVDAALLCNADPRDFLRFVSSRSQVDLSHGFALAVGRIEPRKNQLRLIAALAGGPPLVIIGHDGDAAYAATCRASAGPEVFFAGPVHDARLLASAYGACRLLAHLSLAEGATMVALEAAAAGAVLLLSDHPAHREYIGPFARYVPPLDTDAIRKAVEELWHRPPLAGERRLQALHVAEAHAYPAHAARLADLYADALL